MTNVCFKKPFYGSVKEWTQTLQGLLKLHIKGKTFPFPFSFLPFFTVSRCPRVVVLFTAGRAAEWTPVSVVSLSFDL